MSLLNFSQTPHKYPRTQYTRSQHLLTTTHNSPHLPLRRDDPTTPSRAQSIKHSIPLPLLSYLPSLSYPLPRAPSFPRLLSFKACFLPHRPRPKPPLQPHINTLPTPLTISNVHQHLLRQPTPRSLTPSLSTHHPLFPATATTTLITTTTTTTATTPPPPQSPQPPQPQPR